MRDKKYTLTISILASNRKDTLPKTLKSIKPVLDNVSSELIVTDTGCDEDLLTEIRRYTDKIVKFQWCNDFAKARNVALDMAEGQWFLFIDDDEWFEDVSDIIDFFNSDEKDRYGHVQYIVRNYRNAEGTVWNDAPISRGTRLEEGIRFTDAVHERFTAVLQPVKVIESYAHHYGYVFANENDRMEHSRRNIALLEKLFEEGNHSLRQYFHVLEEYNALSDHEKAYEMALQGLQKAKENQEHSKKYESLLKVNVAYSLYGMRRDPEALEWIECNLREGGLTIAAYGAMNAYRACASFNTGDSLGVIEAAEEYFCIYNYLINYKMQMANDALLAVADVYQNRMFGIIFNMSLICAVLENDRSGAERILSWHKYNKEMYIIDNGQWLCGLIDMMSDSDNKELYGPVVAHYMDDMQCAAKICNKLLDIKENSEGLFMNLVEQVVNCDRDNPYVKMLRTIYSGLKNAGQ